MLQCGGPAKFRLGVQASKLDANEVRRGLPMRTVDTGFGVAVSVSDTDRTDIAL